MATGFGGGLPQLSAGGKQAGLYTYVHMYICTETKQAVSTYGTFGKDFTPNSCQFSNQKSCSTL